MQPRRTFLKTAASAPSLRWVGSAGDAGRPGSSKFAPVNLIRFYNSSATDFGPRESAKRWGDPQTSKDGLVRPPSGRQRIHGIPFHLGPAGVRSRSWVAIGPAAGPSTASKIEIPLDAEANFLCLAQFCDWAPQSVNPGDVDAIPELGQKLADAVLSFDDGSERTFPIRRGFEVNNPWMFGGPTYCALSSNWFEAGTLADALAGRGDIGDALKSFSRRTLSNSKLSIWALENPQPGRKMKALRLEAAAGGDLLVLCGLTLYRGSHNPLWRERRNLYRFTLPSATAQETGRWKVEADIGLTGRTSVPSAWDPEAWLRREGPGFGDGPLPVKPTPYLLVELIANPGATVTLRDSKTGTGYEFDLDRLVPGKELPARQGGPRIEMVEKDRVWVRGRVVDDATGRPTPARIAFRTGDGRYIPPYGHTTTVSPTYLGMFGGDVVVGDSTFAYIDGNFQVELPAGEVYVEAAKGFEYQGLRRKLSITPAQRDIELRVSRHADLRSKGWITADVHVHFLSPSTAVLEAQAEDLNLVHLLAAQWGDWFTNVADLPHGPLVSADKQTMVCMGTENRQHIMGHIGLLGGRGEPVYPLSADGANESYLGEPLWSTMAEWADACREREGVTIGVHFPGPLGELPADIVLGKIDAVELYPAGEGGFRTVGYGDWYRYLNCGYRVSVTGGTDKMSATMPLGSNRTYAYLGKEEFTFPNWAKAVKQGRTFATSGPLLMFEADGRVPGDEIQLQTGGGTIEVKAEASCQVPLSRLEVLFNGRVVASREDRTGARQMALAEKVKVPGAGWLAARCWSPFRRHCGWRHEFAAHTSPVYVKVQGQELFSAPAITYMLRVLEGTDSYVKNLALRPDPARLAKIVKVLDDARAHLNGRLRASS